MMMVDARWASRMMLSYLWKHCITNLLTDFTTVKDFVFSIPALLAHPAAIFDTAAYFDGFRRQLCILVMSVWSFASSSFLFNSKSGKHCTTAGRGGVGGLQVVRAAVLAAALLTPCQALSYALTTQPPQDAPSTTALSLTAGHVLLGPNSSPLTIRRLAEDEVNDVEGGVVSKARQDTAPDVIPRKRCQMSIAKGTWIGIVLGGLMVVVAIGLIIYGMATGRTAPIDQSRNTAYNRKFGSALFFPYVVVVGERELNHWKLSRWYQRAEHL
eukprot:GHVS01068319.1.p1 GENE.GHVS01068319.1~~GHVS01068319.1.p1  ORF type:complete len:270 (-),score=31.14 GHVS01068319.1:728-1537(-)